MIETLAAISLAAGFLFVVVLIIGPEASEPALPGLFALTPMPARPRGVQETDLAPFAFRDPGSAATSTDDALGLEGRMDPALAA
jgi:hypothetical protein